MGLVANKIDVVSSGYLHRRSFCYFPSSSKVEENQQKENLMLPLNFKIILYNLEILFGCINFNLENHQNCFWLNG